MIISYPHLTDTPGEEFNICLLKPGVQIKSDHNDHFQFENLI